MTKHTDDIVIPGILQGIFIKMKIYLYVSIGWPIGRDHLTELGKQKIRWKMVQGVWASAVAWVILGCVRGQRESQDLVVSPDKLEWPTGHQHGEVRRWAERWVFIKQREVDYCLLSTSLLETKLEALCISKFSKLGLKAIKLLFLSRQSLLTPVSSALEPGFCYFVSHLWDCPWGREWDTYQFVGGVYT